MSALRLVRPLGRRLHCQPSEHLLQCAKFPRVLCSFISSKANMGEYQRPPPFPYKEQKYNRYYQVCDRTIDRFNENTKVLVVDGPIAAGKSTFAKQLAEELDMLYFPEADPDMSYILPNGFDKRQLNSRLPVRVQFTDIKDITRNPKHPNIAQVQMLMLQLRWSQYIDALAHLFNTGQGVVMDRSVYSDFVFMEALVDGGYLSKEFKNYYEKSFEAIFLLGKRPHLVIYLDIPVKTVLERIKQRNRDWEVNSPLLTEKYLGTMERAYKLTFLREMSVSSEVLVYDWSNFGEVEAVVDDIERLDFTEDPYSHKFNDWKVEYDRQLGYERYVYTNEKDLCLEKMDPGLLLPELFRNHYENEALLLLEEEMGINYEPGYNPKQGDNVLLKV
ncbi:NADH dehydrogenase [ubiquinone] 1 alpha subcomplex subunit 10, mitochondrial [Frankliniella fusca]|uniref:NADH dehydrogenase [ubiquinone] 1 alpha subcomplex subunit 10, mitochondrial n=1 Tax=Frankliniella fusca TaxID=407009 RepID=A0AAE1HQX2_9NEOP|nr:NADH dehydrogenase [ubiquinone] 1 alpha subcomplex subunit 10, mitochondrial [Frankliniella fusca]